MQEVEAMKPGAVAVADQAGELLDMIRFKFDPCECAEAMRLLTTCNAGWAKQTANRLAAERATTAIEQSSFQGSTDLHGAHLYAS